LPKKKNCTQNTPKQPQNDLRRYRRSSHAAAALPRVAAATPYRATTALGW